MAPIDKTVQVKKIVTSHLVRYHCKIVEIKFQEEFFVSKNSHIFL